jgi:hypothetical protein
MGGVLRGQFPTRQMTELPSASSRGSFSDPALPSWAVPVPVADAREWSWDLLTRDANAVMLGDRHGQGLPAGELTPGAGAAQHELETNSHTVAPL